MYLPKLHWRMAFGGVVVMGLWKALGTSDYLGLGVPGIVRAFTDPTMPSAAFALKLLFTAVTLGAGFLGGEVTPIILRWCSIRQRAGTGARCAAGHGRRPWHGCRLCLRCKYPTGLSRDGSRADGQGDIAACHPDLRRRLSLCGPPQYLPPPNALPATNTVSCSTNPWRCATSGLKIQRDIADAPSPRVVGCFIFCVRH